MSTQKNPEEMSMDELRQYIESQLPEHPLQEQPRDDQGRFVSQEQKPAPEEKTVYQHTVDLGDGSGVQVFEAESLEALVEELGKAQKNATRKIREQAQALKDRPAPLPVVEEEKPLTDNEKWLLRQRMNDDPTGVINEYVSKEVAKQNEARRKADEAAQTAQAAIKTTVDQWVADNAGYHRSQKNGEKMLAFLELKGLSVSPENLTAAFNDLNGSGLLEARPSENNSSNDGQQHEAQQQEQRIAEPAQPVVTTVRRKVVGSISTKRSAPVEQSVPGLTEEQLSKMPFHELEALMYANANK